jgi:hypothetical protein
MGALWRRLPGVKPNTFQAPLRPRLMGAAMLPDAWSEIVGTPITLGENDIHGDCVAVAAFNAAAVANARRGIMTSFADHEPFDLYCKLGGMPADNGLDPAALFTFWQANAIGGYKLGSIETIALDDIVGIKQAIIDTGFVYFTATLTEAQMTQDDWIPVQSPIDGGHATVLTHWEAGWLYDDTWGSTVRVSPEFISKQGQNLWRLDLVPS